MSEPISGMGRPYPNDTRPRGPVGETRQKTAKDGLVEVGEQVYAVDEQGQISNEPVGSELKPEESFRETLKEKFPGITVSQLRIANLDGGFVFRTRNGENVALRIKPEVKGARGREEVSGWQIVELDGSYGVFEMNGIFRDRGLGDMPVEVRMGLDKTAELKRTLGITDTFLFQAEALNAQRRNKKKVEQTPKRAA